MFNDTQIIIAGSGASVLFTDKLDTRLKEIIESNVSIGINYFAKYGCSTTFTLFGDYQFYFENEEWLKDLGLIIGKLSDQVKEKELPNTILLPGGRYYFGMDSWKINKKQCLDCKEFYPSGKSSIERCNKCKTILQPVGFWHHHLSGIWSITLALCLGFKEIYLLGYDCCEINGKTHFYQNIVDLTQKKKCDGRPLFSGIGKKTTGKKDYNTCTYNDIEKTNDYWYGPFKDIKEAKIYNVSPESMLNVFSKITYEEFFVKVQNNNIDQDLTRKEIVEYIKEKTK